MASRKTYPQNKDYNPVLSLGNNTGSDITVSLFNNTDFAVNSAYNAKTQYSWDITAETFAGAASVSIGSKTGPNPYQTYTVPLPLPTPQGVANALNALLIGLFTVVQAGGKTYIRTWNDTVQYSNLNISGTTAYPAFTMNMNIFCDNSTGNTTPVIISAKDNTAGGQPMLSITNSNSGLSYNIASSTSSQFSFLSNGDTVQLDITSTPPVGTVALFSSLNLVLKQNGIVIFAPGAIAGTVPGSFTPPITFPYLLNAAYDLSATIRFL